MRIKLSMHKTQDVGRLVGNFVVVLQEVEGVVREVEPGLRPIMLLW